jgi:hypothetical protein
MAISLGELGVSLLMLNWYLYKRNTDCPKTPISRPKEKRGEPRATVPLSSSNYSEGPVSTQFLLCDGPLNQVPILQAWDWLWFKVVKGTIQRNPKYHTQSLVR